MFFRIKHSDLTGCDFSSVVQSLIDKRAQKTNKRIRWLSGIEHRPYTQNHHYLSSYREQYLTKYKGERRKQNQRSPATEEVDVQDVIGKLVALGYQIRTREDLERLVPPDPYDEVLIVMSEVRAYWQVAYKVRVIILCVYACADRHLSTSELSISSRWGSTKISYGKPSTPFETRHMAERSSSSALTVASPSARKRL